MDGNGRWAKERGKNRLQGHKKGAENVETILSAAKKHGVKFLTLYAFSVENWARPKSEVEGLMRLLKEFLKINTKRLIREEVALRVIGKIENLPKDVQTAIQKSIDATAKFADKNVLCLALNYGARTEIENAMRDLLREARDGSMDIEKMTYADIQRHLYTKDIPDPDLVIRTSGEFRLSNFLLLQSAYSEWYFTDVRWPDFDENCFDEAIENFKKRERRFGMTSEQIIKNQKKYV